MPRVFVPFALRQGDSINPLGIRYIHPSRIMSGTAAPVLHRYYTHPHTHKPDLLSGFLAFQSRDILLLILHGWSI
jgi:hypothetical protein